VDRREDGHENEQLPHPPRFAAHKGGGKVRTESEQRENADG
jgi:hypothetical protein